MHHAFAPHSSRLHRPRHSPALRLILRVSLVFGLIGLRLTTALTAPFITNFDPKQGEPGVQVRITGFQLASITQVQFGGAIADFNVLSAGELVAVVPDTGLSGPIRISDASGADNSDQDFMVAPRITSLSPTRAATNTTLVIKGANLLSTTNVLFGTVPARLFNVPAASQINVTIPAGATSGPVSVLTPAGTAITQGFVVTGPEPIVDDFTPRRANPGTPITVRGANFSQDAVVTVDTLKATTVNVTAGTQLTAQFPSVEVAGKLRVATAAGTNTGPGDLVFTYGPIITNFTPTLGVASTATTTGTRIVVSGLNLTSIVGVGIGTNAASFGVFAQNQIQVTVPKDAVSGLIVVTNRVDGTNRVGLSEEPFIVTLAPVITNFTPGIGKVSDVITLFGMNMGDASTALFFNGTQAVFAVTGQNGTQVRATVPKGATSGPLTMTNSAGAFTTTNSFYVTGAAPYVTALTPNAGPRGLNVLFSGGNFTAPATVRFGGVAATTVAVAAINQLQATVPAGAFTGPITLITNNGTNTNSVVFYAPPRLTQIIPTEGVEGTPVTLRGTNFLGATRVLFNDTPTRFTVTASNLIATTVPLDALSGPVTVQAPGGTIVSSTSFVVLPRILGFTPALGPVGTSVEITGTSFRGVKSVTFKNIPATFTVTSPTLITATVPAGATTGPITVTTDDGTAVSPESFEVTFASDLGLSLVALPPSLPPNDTVTFRLQLTNAGPSTLTRLLVSNPVPPELPVVSFSTGKGEAAQSENTVTWTLPVFTNGATATLEIVARASAEGVFVNTAVAEAREGDTHPADNRASATVVVIAPASRTLTINALPADQAVLLSWPVSPVPFELQEADPLNATNEWAPVPVPPAQIDGRNVVTNSGQGIQQYFRLEQK